MPLISQQEWRQTAIHLSMLPNQHQTSHTAPTSHSMANRVWVGRGSQLHNSNTGLLRKNLTLFPCMSWFTTTHVITSVPVAWANHYLAAKLKLLFCQIKTGLMSACVESVMSVCVCVCLGVGGLTSTHNWKDRDMHTPEILLPNLLSHLIDPHPRKSSFRLQ